MKFGFVIFMTTLALSSALSLMNVNKDGLPRHRRRRRRYVQPSGDSCKQNLCEETYKCITVEFQRRRHAKVTRRRRRWTPATALKECTGSSSCANPDKIEDYIKKCSGMKKCFAGAEKCHKYIFCPCKFVCSDWKANNCHGGSSLLEAQDAKPNLVNFTIDGAGEMSRFEKQDAKPDGPNRVDFTIDGAGLMSRSSAGGASLASDILDDATTGKCTTQTRL